MENLENIHFSLSNQQELYEKSYETRDEVKCKISKLMHLKNIDISKSSYYPTLFLILNMDSMMIN